MVLDSSYMIENCQNLHDHFKSFHVPLWSQQMALNSFILDTGSAASAFDGCSLFHHFLNTSNPVITGLKSPLQLGLVNPVVNRHSTQIWFWSAYVKASLVKGSYSPCLVLHQVLTIDDLNETTNLFLHYNVFCQYFNVDKAALSLLYTGSAACLFTSSLQRKPWQSERPHWAGLPSEHYKPGEVCTCTNSPQSIHSTFP